MEITEQDETTYGKFCMVVGEISTAHKSETGKWVKTFSPLRIPDKRFFQTREQATAWQKRWRSAVKLPKGDSARVLSVPQLKKLEGGMRILHDTLASRAIADVERYLADQAVDAEEQYTDAEIAALISAVVKVCRNEDVTISEAINIDLNKIDFEAGSNEGISASTRTSVWSTSVKGTWTTNEGRTFELEGTYIGDATRI